MIDIQNTVCRLYCACDSISRNSLFLKLFGSPWNSTFTILFLMSVENISLFNSVLDEALERLGKKNLKLKECQYEAVKAVVVDRKDTICILPSGYGNSLILVIYQLLPFVLLNYLFPTHAQYGRHTVFCMSITDYPRASDPKGSQARGTRLVYFSLTGTVSTSPNLAKEGARSAAISVLFCYIKTILTHWDCIYFAKFGYSASPKGE